MRLVELLRFGFRTSMFVVSTVFLWLGMELEMLCTRGKRIDVVNKWVPRWARFNLKVFGLQVEAHGTHLDEGELYPSEGADGIGRIFVANHSSGMDIPILFTVAETHVISRHDVADWPILGRTSRRIGTLFVDRDSRRSGAAVLREVDKTLKRGEGVAMFPEGTAHEDGRVHEFHSGAFNSARRAGAEIVPIGIAYSDDTAYYAKQPFMRHMKRIACLRGMRVAVEVGEPITYVEDGAVETKDLAREQVQALVDRAQARLA